MTGIKHLAQILLGIGFILFVYATGAMTVEEAYRAIPHEQTDFDTKAAKMSAEESAFLAQFFTLVNYAIVAKVETLQWFSSKGRHGSPYGQYKMKIDNLITEFQGLNVPKNLTDVHKLVLESVIIQHAYYEKWDTAVKRGEQFRFNRNDQLISNSSARLIQAYHLLMAHYPQEAKNNKSAFYDYLCALDFI